MVLYLGFQVLLVTQQPAAVLLILVLARRTTMFQSVLYLGGHMSILGKGSDEGLDQFPLDQFSVPSGHPPLYILQQHQTNRFRRI